MDRALKFCFMKGEGLEEVARPKPNLFWKLLLIVIIPLDLLAVASWLGAAPCLGGKLDTCSPLKPAILITAGTLTAIYLIKYYRASSKQFSWRGSSKISWDYAIFLWWSIAFFGEALPQLAGIWRGITPGEYGYHFGLMNNPLAWFKTGMIWDILTFGLLGIFGAVLYRYLYWPLATVIAMTVAASLEFSLFNEAASFDTYSPQVDLVGTIVFLLSTWAIYFSLTFGLYSLIEKWWHGKGRALAVIIIILANFASAVYFAYIRTIDPKAEQRSPGSENEILPDNSCPDQILYNNGPLVLYKNSKEYTPKDQATVDWINANCPGTQKIYDKPVK